MGTLQRKLPIGAEPMPEGGVHFRVWSSRSRKVEVVLEDAGQSGTTVALAAEEGGYFSGVAPTASPGSLYRFRLDNGGLFPDPASRFQPNGPHGPSCVVDPVFSWTDHDWHGVAREGQVLYEMHVGTFTTGGTWNSAAEQLAELADIGITVVEMMPVAEFPGRFGWGYDGVNIFAPTRLYGQPADLRRFVDRAHAVGIGVILDVVYNHFGPEGNYLKQFSDEYYTNNYENEWGEPLNFDGAGSEPVREFYVANATYWIEEFHLDGLRFDATQSMFDRSPRHILACIVERSRKAAGSRSTLMIGENEPQLVHCLRSADQKGFGLDAVWNDDFHHSAHVGLTGYNEAYYSEYLGSPQELISAVKWSYLYQGQRYFWQEKSRGNPTFGLSPCRFINYLESHDQIANSAWGARIHQQSSPGSYRAMTALLLLAPQTPMLFQGQEFAASSPFLYFSDLDPEVARQVRQGRIDFLRQFTNISTPEIIDSLDNPADPATFERSHLDLAERDRHAPAYALHRDLLRLRREDPVFSAAWSGRIEGAVLGPAAFLLRYFAGGDERLLLLNLGRDLRLHPAPEPLLAPPENRRWEIAWTSEKVDYGGSETPELETDTFWLIQGHAAVVLRPVPERGYHADRNP